MVFVLLIFFPGCHLHFDDCLLLNTERSSRIRLLPISEYVEEHYADSALTRCVLFLVIEHFLVGISRNFGLAFSKKFYAAIEGNVFGVR